MDLACEEEASLPMPNFCERFSVYAHRLYYSKAWSIFYVSMLLTNLAAIVALIAVHVNGHATEKPGWLLFIEIMVNLLLVFEVSVRIAAQQRRFFNDACNVFDFVIMLLCVVCFVVYLDAPAEDKETALVGTIVLAVRYAVVFIRMAHITFQLKSRADQLDVDDVDFSLMVDDDGVGDSSFGDDF